MFTATLKTFSFDPVEILKEQGVETETPKSLFFNFESTKVTLDITELEEESEGQTTGQRMRVVQRVQINQPDVTLRAIAVGQVADVAAKDILYGWFLQNCVYPTVNNAETDMSKLIQQHFPEFVQFFVTAVKKSKEERADV